MKPLIRALKACGDENRLRILKMLQHREMCVCELTEALGISQPSVSRHMKILEDADLVVHRRAGLWMNYRLNQDPANPYAKALLGQIHSWLHEDPEIQGLLEKASTMDREVICRRDTHQTESSIAEESTP